MRFEKSTKLKHLIPKVAEKHNLDSKMLQDVVDAYYSELYQSVRELKYPAIRFLYFGTLKLSRAKLEKDIEKLKKVIDDKTERGVFKKTTLRMNQETLRIKEKALLKLDQSNEQSKREYTERLEKQKQNSGGNKE